MSTLRRGYTLIEILVTVLVLTFLSAFIIPTYQLILSQLQLNSAVEQVAEQIRLAEQKTVTEQQIYGITMVSGGTTIPLFLYNVSNGSKTTQSTLTLPSNIIISAVNFSSNTDVRFTTSGAPNVSGNLVLKDTVRSRYRKVEIRPSGNILTNTAEY